MASYKIFHKSDLSTAVYEYTADHIIEWDIFPFSIFEHVLFVPTIDPIPQVYEGRRRLTKLEFRRLFTPTEIELIDEFAATYTQKTLPAELVRKIRTGLADYQYSENISLDDEACINGTNLYEYLGLIAAGRAAEVLNG